jgi:UDP-GlcNAc:undecaprenyl-phosphate GlcNAc-1-phosphate transferase
MNRYVLLAVIAFCVAEISIRVLSKLAPRLRLVDHPGGRKRHHAPIPVVGGVGVFAGFIVAMLAVPDGLGVYKALLGSAALVTVTGMFDDMHDLKASGKLNLQALAAVFVASWGGQVLYTLGNLFGLGPVTLQGWAYPFTIVAILGLINAFNMIDGVDGLASGVAAATVAILGYAALSGGHTQALLILGVFMAALIAFIPHNFPFLRRHRARVFLGDAGSMLIGIVLAWFTIALSQGQNPAFVPIVAVWILAVPLVDMAYVMSVRIAARRSPFSAGREHLHHVLADKGWSARRIALAYSATSLLLGGGALFAARRGLPESVLFYFFIGLVVAYVAVMRLSSAHKIRLVPEERGQVVRPSKGKDNHVVH